ncbi:MAG TPA: hypothetical protein VJ302_27005 [Blastocatellia bacterium]|nr:hypothetical protein [Blastocatellia bacterium]
MYYLESLFSGPTSGFYLLIQFPSAEDLHLVVWGILASLMTGLIAMFVLVVLMIIGLVAYHYAAFLIAQIRANMWRLPNYFEQQKFGPLINKYFGN